jgi:carbonic anhydrase/acetyltransferase-like protein (isoleucine patch superfamily)
MIFSFEGKEPKIGKGTYVSDTARVIGDVTLGEKCYIGHGAVIRADYGKIVIGSGTAVQEGALVCSPLDSLSVIGDFVTIAYGAIVHSKEIGNHSVVGMGAILGIDARIGEWTIVAEGGVVRMRQIVPNNMVVGGNPAHTIREATPKDHENWLGVKELYQDLAGRYLQGAMKPLTKA